MLAVNIPEAALAVNAHTFMVACCVHVWSVVKLKNTNNLEKHKQRFTDWQWTTKHLATSIQKRLHAHLRVRIASQHHRDSSFAYLCLCEGAAETHPPAQLPCVSRAAARCARTDLRLCAVIVAVRTRAVRAVAPRATVKSCGSGAPAGRALAVSIVTVAAERVPLPTRSTKSTKVAINAPGF